MLVLLVDGMNLIRRVYAAVPGEEGTAAHLDGVLESCRRSLQRALSEVGPSHALCALESEERSWRQERYPDYKANRPPMPSPLAALLPRIETAFAELGVPAIRAPGFEADDVLASVAVKIAAHAGEAVILSTDKSMLALLRPGIRVRDHFSGRELDREYLRARFAVEPAQLPAYLALVGDPAQNVPGVRSVGPKTAARLIAEHGTLEAILDAADAQPARLAAALRTSTAEVGLWRELATLRTDVEVGMNLSACRLPGG